VRETCRRRQAFRVKSRGRKMAGVLLRRGGWNRRMKVGKILRLGHMSLRDERGKYRGWGVGCSGPCWHGASLNDGK